MIGTMSRMKTCFRCQRRLPFSDFYAHPMMADGRLGKCKDCTRQDVQKNRKKNIWHYRRYDRERQRNPERLALAAEINRRWRSEDKRRSRAHNAVNRAVRAGKLSPGPCEVCGSDDVHGHHDDYDKPLSVRWLCAEHHVAHHHAIRKKH